MKRGRPQITSHDIIKEYLELDDNCFSIAKNSNRNYMRALRAVNKLERIRRWFNLVKPDLTYHQIIAFKDCNNE